MVNKKHFIVYSDGGARGNPGPAALGGVIYERQDGELVSLAKVSKYLGEKTNNQAEYLAVIAVLQKAKDLGAESVECYLDSELIVNQLLLKYKVKNKELGKLFVEAWRLLTSFKKYSVTHVPREQNKPADSLVNLTLDEAGF